VAHFSRQRDLKGGSTLGNYEIVRRLGVGGMGTVFEAEHRALGRRVAVKVLHAEMTGHGGLEAGVERFLREGRAAAQVRHPNVIDVFDVGTDDGVPYLIMELVDGVTFADKLARAPNGALDLHEVLAVMVPVLRAVSALHSAGVVHRDLKPANILLAKSPAGIVPKVADFGLSRALGDEPLTRSGAVMGTIEYMSPEHIRGGAEFTARSDQYALGVILYEAATGRRPFDGTTVYELLHAVVTADLVLPSARNPALPPGFDHVVSRALHREPERRFDSVDDLAQALLALVSEETRDRWRADMAFLHTVPLPVARSRPRGWRSWLARHRFARRAAMVLALGLFGLAVANVRTVRPARSDGGVAASAPPPPPPSKPAPTALTAPEAEPRAPLADPPIAPPAPAAAAPAVSAHRSRAPTHADAGTPAEPSSRPLRGQNGAPILDVE
jgi:serine/threonine protein kinase